jgi:hypothetical protein
MMAKSEMKGADCPRQREFRMQTMQRDIWFVQIHFFCDFEDSYLKPNFLYSFFLEQKHMLYYIVQIIDFLSM